MTALHLIGLSGHLGYGGAVRLTGRVADVQSGHAGPQGFQSGFILWQGRRSGDLLHEPPGDVQSALGPVGAHGGLVDGDEHIQRGQHDGELPHGSVGPVGPLRLAHPDLEAVTQEVVEGLGVVDGLGGRIVLVGGGQTDIVLGQDPLPLPDAAVGVELHKPQVVLGGGEKSAAAHLHAVGHAHPAQVVRINADLVEQAGRQILVEPQPGLLTDDGPQHGGAGGVIHVSGAGNMIYRGMEEIPDPVLGGPGHLVHAAAHAQNVPHRELLKVLAGVLRGLLGENVDEPLVQLQ